MLSEEQESLSFLYEEPLLLTQSIADISMNGSCDDFNHERVSQAVFDSKMLIIEDDNDDGEKVSSQYNESNKQLSKKEKASNVCESPFSNEQDSSVKSKKQTWKKPKGMPKRPMSAYNLYFQLERERLIKGQDDEVHSFFTSEDVDRIVLQRKILDSKPKPKRKHCKTHGKIGFGDMARTIAHSWKMLDESQKQIFTDRAAIEKGLYNKAVKEWSKKQDEINTKSQPIVDSPPKENNKGEHCCIIPAPESPKSVFQSELNTITDIKINDVSAPDQLRRYEYLSLKGDFVCYNQLSSFNSAYYIPSTNNRRNFENNILGGHKSSKTTIKRKCFFDQVEQPVFTLNGKPVPPMVRKNSIIIDSSSPVL